MPPLARQTWHFSSIPRRGLCRNPGGDFIMPAPAGAQAGPWPPCRLPAGASGDSSARETRMGGDVAAACTSLRLPRGGPEPPPLTPSRLPLPQPQPRAPGGCGAPSRGAAEKGKTLPGCTRCVMHRLGTPPRRPEVGAAAPGRAGAGQVAAAGRTGPDWECARPGEGAGREAPRRRGERPGMWESTAAGAERRPAGGPGPRHGSTGCGERLPESGGCGTAARGDLPLLRG